MRSRFFSHPLGIDEQFVDDAGQPREREIERDGRVGADEALDRRVRNVALVPQGDILHRRNDRAAHHAGKPGEILGQHRVALVRHRRAALLAGREIFLGLEHFGALQVADFGRQPLDRGGDHAERGEEHRVAVARDDLGRDRLGLEAELVGDMGFDLRARRWRKCRLRPRSRRWRCRRAPQSGARGPVELGVSLSQLEAEAGRLGVDAVAAADRRGQSCARLPAA